MEEFLILKKDLLEYLSYCGLFKQIKQKFTTFQISFEDDDQSVLIVKIVVETLRLIDTMTNEVFILSPILQKLYLNVLSNMLFIFEETELGGCLHLLASILLSGGSYNRSIKDLPQPCIEMSYFVFKILNNLARISLHSFHKIISESNFNIDQYYHVALYVFAYCH